MTLPLLALTGCSRGGFPEYPDGYREFAYVANSEGNTVTVLDLVYLRPDRTLSVGNTPIALAENPKRDEVYVVNSQPGQSAGSVSVIDTTKNTVVATIPVHRNPSYISVTVCEHDNGWHCGYKVPTVIRPLYSRGAGQLTVQVPADPAEPNLK